jgi:hypothetical protein
LAGAFPAGRWEKIAGCARQQKRYPQTQGFPLTLAANLCDNSKLQQEQEITILYLSGGMVMATKTNFILKVAEAKLADVQKALKDANINVVSIMEIHKEGA